MLKKISEGTCYKGPQAKIAQIISAQKYVPQDLQMGWNKRINQIIQEKCQKQTFNYIWQHFCYSKYN